MKNIKIIIATHKEYFMPLDDMYLPVHVGKEGKVDIGYQGDNEGENISIKNPSFCELTGLYWAWQNLPNDYLGLLHYRRFCTTRGRFERKNQPLEDLYLTHKEASDLLADYDVIVPSKRNYYIETLYSHYANTLHAEHLDVTREIIAEKCGEFLGSFDKVMKQRSGYMFNMFIMSKELTNSYCSWLFPILFELEKRLPADKYSAFHARFYGRVSELLFNVWLMQYNKKTPIKIKELPFVYGEKVNWGKKILAFLQAKFLGKKYEASF